MIKKINLNSVDGITFEVINKINEIIDVLNESPNKPIPDGAIPQATLICTCYGYTSAYCPIHHISNMA